MKVRNGFVSNSSTTSFLIWGAQIKEEPEWKSVRESDLELFYGDTSWEHSVFLGMSWDQVKDDETGAQFKERVEKEVEKLMGEKLECSSHSRAYYDG